MKKWKNLSRRGLAMALAMTVCLSFSQLTAFADEMDDDVSDSMTGGETIGDLPAGTDIAIPLQTAEELNAYAEMAELSPEDMAEMGMVYPMLMEGFGPSLLSGETTFDPDKYAEWRGLELDGTWDAEGKWADGSPIMEIDAEGNAKFFEPKGPMGEATVTYTFEKPVLPDETDSDESDETSSEESDDASSEESSEVSSEESSETSSEESSETSSEDSSETSSEESSETPAESVDSEPSESTTPSESAEPTIPAPSEDTTLKGEDENVSKDEDDTTVGESHADAKDAGVAVFAPRMLFDEGEDNEPEEIEEEPLLPETPAEPETVTLEWKVVVTSTVEELSAGEEAKTLPDLRTKLQEGKSVYLTDDIEFSGETIRPTGTATLNLHGHKISYAANAKGNMFEVSANSVFTIINAKQEESEESLAEGQIIGCEANTGSLVVVDGGTFNLEGGTLTGNEKGTPWENQPEPTSGYGSYSVEKYVGAGVYVVNGTFNMSGGTISNNATIYTDAGSLGTGLNPDTTYAKYYLYYRDSKDGVKRVRFANPLGQGAGVYVSKDGIFNLSDGTITGNNAGEGGGVFVKDGLFNMTGGDVSGNVAHLGEGGGIYIQSANESNLIKGGSITGNTTETTEDLGGGGIYVESDGYLKLQNARITGNEANGLGGGIAACVHGKIALVSLNGAAVYGNKAYGIGYVDSFSMDQLNKGENADFIDSYSQWKENGDFKEAAQDIFSAGSKAQPNSQGHIPGAVIGNIMVGEGLANWSGWKNDAKGENFTPVEVNGKNGSVYAGNLLALEANPKKEAKDAAVAATGVLISGNKSTKTHGGGVATNGMLDMGLKTESIEGASVVLNLHKTLKDSRDLDDNPERNVPLKGNEFTFELLDSAKKPIKVNSEAVTAKNDENGDTTIMIPASALLSAGTHTFYVREVKGDAVGMAYDETLYKVDVEVSKSTETTYDKIWTLNGSTITNYKVDSTTITHVDSEDNIIDEDAEPIETLSFTNTMEYCNLTVEKKVWYEDTSAIPTDGPEFLIQVKIGNSDKLIADSCRPKVGSVGTAPYDEEGIYKVYLKAGEKLTITDIPAGMKYEVTEPGMNKETPNADGYTLETITSEEGVLDSDIEVLVANRYYKARTINVSVEKKWQDKDGNNYEGDLMPKSVTVRLLQDGNVYKYKDETQFVLTADNDWKYEWENLPEYAGQYGEKHSYTVKELNIDYGEDYQVTAEGSNLFYVADKEGVIIGGWISYSTNDGDAVTLTNTWGDHNELGTLSLNINKIDSENKDPIAGAEFELRRTDPSDFRYPTQLTDAEGKITFVGLTEGRYRLKEIKPAPGYQVNEKNTWIVEISKGEDGKAKVDVMRVSDSSSEPSEELEKNNWSAVGDTITVENDIIKGKIRLTKTVTGVGNIPAEKEFTFNVYSIEREGAGIPVGAEPAAVLKAVHNATDTTAELPYGWYAIVETGNTAIGGYVFNGVTFDGTANRYDVFVGEGEKHNETYTVAAVNNYRVPEPEEEEETTSVSVNKVWVGDTAANRPASITVNLLRDGEVYDTVTLSARNGWYASWSNLDDESSWTVEEVNVPEGYTSTISGRSAFTITNTFTTEEEIPEEDTPLSDTPEVVVPELDTPLADKPVDEEETIVDEDIPLADVPKTGDHANVTLWAALLAASLAGLLALVRKIRGEDK